MQWYRRRVHGDIAWDPATSTTTTMNTFLFFSSLIAYVSAGTVAVAPVAGVVVGNAAPYLVRAPAHDSASIEHHRLGGNFAYSTAEAHAFAEVIPQISTLTHPVAETTHTHIPSPIDTFQPAPMEPSTSPDQSVPIRLSTSQSFTRPGPTPSRPCPRLLLPQSTLSNMSQLLLTLLPQLPMPLMLLPQLPTPELPTLDLPTVPMPMVLMLLPQPSLPKQRPKFSSVPKSERGLYRLCAVSDFLRHTKLYNRRVGVSWWLFLVSLRIASNVSNALQYDVTTSITSGLFSLLNVLYSRYRRELFINKSVLFLQ